MSQESDTTPPQSGRISPIYLLEPLPGSVSAPITLTIQPVLPIPTTGKAFVFVKFDGEDDRGPMVLPASVVNGKLIATLPAMPAGSVVSTAANNTIGQHAAVVDPQRLASLIWALGGISEITSPSGKFLVHYPVGDSADQDLAEKVGVLMDEARLKLAATGIEVDRRTTPIDVYLYSFTGVQGGVLWAHSNTNGESESELWGKQGIGLSLNLDQIKGNWENAKTTAAHEMFHIYQSLYDPRGSWRRTFSNSPWLWMLEASATWFEKKVASTSSYLSPNTQAYSDFLYRHGLEYAPGYSPGDKDPVSRHGYGATLFLDYLTAQKGDNMIGEVMKDMQPSTGLVFKASLYSPVEALMRQEILLGSKWTDFVKQLANGKVNPAINVSVLASPASGLRFDTYTSRTDSDVDASFRWDAADLSANGYKFIFVSRETKWITGSKMTFSLSAGNADASADVFVGTNYRGSFSSAANFEIAGADLLAKNGGQVFVLLSNGHAKRPFNDSTLTQISMRVTPITVAIPPAEKADVLFEVYRVYKNVVGTSTQQCNSYSITIKNAAGGVVEDGQSSERNGAYDTRLEVGDGYTYTINYNYALPCRDSGTKSGRFDVKKNIINYIKVETPPCQAN